MRQAGQQAQAPTQDDNKIELDFSGLFSKQPAAPAEPAAESGQSNEIELDFSGLFSREPNKALEAALNIEQYKNAFKRENRPDAQKTGLQGRLEAEAPVIPALIMRSKREDEDNKRTLEVYKTYQENTIKSEQLQAEILKGARAGADIYTLFLKAVDAIACMTSNACFRSQIEADLKSIYGAGLLEQPPLKLDLEQSRARLQRLTEARDREQNQDSKQRIGAAIKAHENKIAELEALLTRAS